MDAGNRGAGKGIRSLPSSALSMGCQNLEGCWKCCLSQERPGEGGEKNVFGAEGLGATGRAADKERYVYSLQIGGLKNHKTKKPQARHTHPPQKNINKGGKKKKVLGAERSNPPVSCQGELGLRWLVQRREPRCPQRLQPGVSPAPALGAFQAAE